MKSKIFFLSLLIICGCAQKNIVGPNKPSVPTSGLDHDLSFLKECSQIRTASLSLWLLTCQRTPHADRTEIYEWSVDSQKLKRLTYQDGQIWDIAPIDGQQFYYSSSYDEFKEQFASILSGAKPGSDIYLKNRTETDFKRITSQKGLEISFFWSALSHSLYFVHETDQESQIIILDQKQKLRSVYTSKKTSIRNPIYMEDTKNLYWMEYDAPDKGPLIQMMNAGKKVKSLFRSESKIFQLAAAPKANQLLVGFATGIGIEIWNLNLQDSCWRMAYRISEPVSEFYVLNEKNLFLTIKNSLKQDSFFELGEVCHPSPPGLGISTL